jgi:hypothetical protein
LEERRDERKADLEFGLRYLRQKSTQILAMLERLKADPEYAVTPEADIALRHDMRMLEAANDIALDILQAPDEWHDLNKDTLAYALASAGPGEPAPHRWHPITSESVADFIQQVAMDRVRDTLTVTELYTAWFKVHYKRTSS